MGCRKRQPYKLTRSRFGQAKKSKMSNQHIVVDQIDREPNGLMLLFRTAYTLLEYEVEIYHLDRTVCSQLSPFKSIAQSKHLLRRISEVEVTIPCSHIFFFRRGSCVCDKLHRSRFYRWHIFYMLPCPSNLGDNHGLWRTRKGRNGRLQEGRFRDDS
jgi:hypothetical protein